MIQNLKVKKICSNARIPTQATAYSAGYDLYANIPEQIVLAPKETVKIPTGIAIELPQQTVGLIFGRSGLGIHHGIVPANAVGVIDCDYRGEIIVGLTNHGKDSYTICTKDKIAQLVIMPILHFNMQEVEHLSKTVRGENKFGSTGK